MYVKYTVKESVDFTVKYLASGCQSISRYFTGVYSKDIFRNQDVVGYVNRQHSKYFCIGLKGYMNKNNTCPLLPHYAWQLVASYSTVKSTDVFYSVEYNRKQ